MSDLDLAHAFEAHRAHLRGVAFRMLGSVSEADDAVQEAWLRLARSDAAAIENLGGWLTTVVARVCLDLLRARKARREEPIEAAPELGGGDPERDAALADSVGLALLVVLDTLQPAERLAFVLHDLFGVSFDEIAAIVGRSPAAARQLASRARRRVQGQPEVDHAALARQRDLVQAFLTALRAGDFDGLIAVLDPDVVAHVDGQPGAPPREIRGAVNWAKGAVAFGRVAHDVELATIDGEPGLVFAPGGKVLRALQFTVEGDRIAGVEVIIDPAKVAALEIAIG
jgi:RNA polymerase sigma-70 factor (ECF subfamily)